MSPLNLDQSLTFQWLLQWHVHLPCCHHGEDRRKSEKLCQNSDTQHIHCSTERQGTGQGCQRKLRQNHRRRPDPGSWAGTRSIIRMKSGTNCSHVQIAGAAAVDFTGGPKCSLLMGRPDKGSADNTAGLPSECDRAGDGLARCAATRE